MFKKIIMLLLLVPFLAFAQETGKIAGVVKDKSTGEPLPGVNVVIEGTSYGSATDVDGYYVILNVPVSTYTIRASYIGYKDVVVENVRVSAGVTTELNFELEPTTLELEEAIVITAERPLVEKNLTQSVSLVTSKQIETIPVRGLGSLLALQNSVVIQDGAIHIRGGRSEETGYYLDGASISSPLSNQQAIYVIQEAIEEFQVLAGGYTAEFGGANSGIIRTQLKTGTQNFHASLDFQTDKFVKQEQKFLDTYSYQHHIAVATLSGPLFNKKIRYFLALENSYYGDNQVRFSKGYEFPNIVNKAPIQPDPDNPDTMTIWYPDGFTPHNTTNRYALNGTLLFDYSPIRVRFSGTYNFRRTYLDGAPWLNIFNNRQVYDDLNSALFTGKITHILSPKTFYEVNLSYFYWKSERGDDYFDKDWHKWSDSAAVYDYTGGKVVYRDPWRNWPAYQLLGINFSRDGSYSNFYYQRKYNYLGGALDFVTQYGRHHELKMGIDARYYTVRYFDIAPSVMRFTLPPEVGQRLGFDTYGSIDAVPVKKWIDNGGVDAYGYDIYGNEINDDKDYGDGIYVEGPKHPLFFAAYIQDKIEFNDLIINAGLRFDYFDPDDKKLRDPANPKVDQASSLIPKDEWVKVDPYVQVSPRLGFSFPVSEKTVFYLQYGKFIQMPALNQMYFSTFRMSRQIVQGGFYYINPIGFGLEPMRTTSYEIGFRQQLSNVAAFDITGFYKNVKGQITVDRQVAAQGAVISDYERFVNGDFATTKGLEFRLTLRRTHRLQAQVNYTLTNAEGTGSTNTSYHAAINRGTVKPTVVMPLDYNQTHRGAINLDYRFGKNDGGPILERFGANFLFTFNSGHPYTHVYAPPGGQVDPYSAGVDYMNDTRSRQALEQIGASRTPWNFNIDMRLDKTFTLFGKMDATIYARVTNLLNTKNVINVFEMTGTATDDGYLTDPTRSGQNIATYGQEYAELYRVMNIENGGSYHHLVGRELYSEPRQILFGIKLQY